MIINNRYWLNDLESGQWYEVTKEYYESYHQLIKKAFESFKVVNPEYKGKVIIIGTAGELDNHDSLKELFFDPLFDPSLDKVKSPIIKYFSPDDINNV